MDSRSLQAWQLDAEIAYLSTAFENPLYREEMGIFDFLKNPDVTLNPAHTVGSTLGRSIRLLGGLRVALETMMQKRAA